jgi:hypothetical protein
VRMARLVLSWMRPGSGLAGVREACASAIERAAVRPLPPARPACTDAEVVKFIRSELRHVARPSPTSLLRQLRDERGRACEQKRFSRLYRQVTSGRTSSARRVAEVAGA